MTKIDVSLITATRNRSETLRAMALPSILAQTDQEFQWIVINDGGDAAARARLPPLPPAKPRPFA